jgi:membrane associated rhomboid family serine protease
VLALAEGACLDRVIVFSVPPLTPVVKKLIIALAVAFVLELVLENFVGMPMSRLLALDPIRLGPATLWQVVTYVFVQPTDNPSTITSLLFDLFFMWLIMSPFEAAFGRRHTLELIVSGTLGAAFTVLAFAQIAPIPGFHLYGSSAIAYAGMAAMTQVMRGGRMLLFGAIPMTSRQLLLVLAGIPLVEFLITKNYLSLLGSLGAIFAGIAYVRYMARAPRPSRPKRPASTRLRVLRGGGGGGSNPPRDDGDGDRPKWLN